MGGSVVKHLFFRSPKIIKSSLGLVGLGLVGLGLGCLTTELPAKEVKVQSPNAPVKRADSIEVGQRFECLEDLRLVVYDCPILIRSGSVGMRISESEFFIAKGSLRIGALPPQPSFGFRRSPLLFRFARGELEATGLEWLSVLEGEEIRWQKEAATGLSQIKIDGIQCRSEENTLFVATDREMVLFKPNEKGFQMEDISKLSLSELLLKHRRHRDAQAAISSRHPIETEHFPDDLHRVESARGMSRGKIYGSKP
jgi:hypothetical protein